MVWDDRFQPLTRDEDFWGIEEESRCPGCGELFPEEYEPAAGELCAVCQIEEQP